METYFTNREEWLGVAVQELAPLFTRNGYTIPDKVKVSCGWGAGSRGTSKKILGQCWAPEASAGGNHEIFIAPSVDKPVLALGVLLHQLVHAVVGVKYGHKAPFKAACDKLGLSGKATQALPGEALNRWLETDLLPKLGAYPHDALNDAARKKQTTRMLKAVCPETGYAVRLSKKHADTGTPVSPAGVDAALKELESLAEDMDGLWLGETIQKIIDALKGHRMVMEAADDEAGE